MPSAPRLRLAAACLATTLLTGTFASAANAAPAPVQPAQITVASVAAAAVQPTAAVHTPSAVRASAGKKYKTTTWSNVRTGSSTKNKALGVVKPGYTFTATGVAKNGWIKLKYKGRTAYISNKIVKTVSVKSSGITKYKGPVNPVTKPGRNGKYVTNRAGLPESARWFTKNSNTKVRKSINGSVRATGFPAGTVAWQTKSSGSWAKVNIGGMSGWVKKSELVRKSSKPTSWNNRYSSRTIRTMTNGYLNSSALVAIGWDPGKNLIAGPALKDLNRMNDAFRKEFGHNLEIDLTYRPRTVQDFLYRELGPRLAAKPGTSVHGKGFAIDFPESSGYSFSGKYYKWLKKNSKKYGWNHRKNLEQYTSSGRKNPNAESWHFEYIR